MGATIELDNVVRGSVPFQKLGTRCTSFEPGVITQRYVSEGDFVKKTKCYLTSIQSIPKLSLINQKRFTTLTIRVVRLKASKNNIPEFETQIIETARNYSYWASTLSCEVRGFKHTNGNTGPKKNSKAEWNWRIKIQYDTANRGLHHSKGNRYLRTFGKNRIGTDTINLITWGRRKTMGRPIRPKAPIRLSAGLDEIKEQLKAEK